MRTKPTKNLDIRAEMRQAGIFIWQIADKMNVCDMTLTRQLRYELSDKEKNTIRDIIVEIKTEAAELVKEA